MLRRVLMYVLVLATALMPLSSGVGLAMPLALMDGTIFVAAAAATETADPSIPRMAIEDSPMAAMGCCETQPSGCDDPAKSPCDSDTGCASVCSVPLVALPAARIKAAPRAIADEFVNLPESTADPALTTPPFRPPTTPILI